MGRMSQMGASNSIHSFIQLTFQELSEYLHFDMEGQGHRGVIHSLGEYAKGDDHTNIMEGMLQDLRHWFYTFKGACKKNPQFFISMFTFNYHHRKLNPMDQFTKFLSRILYTLSVT